MIRDNRDVVKQIYKVLTKYENINSENVGYCNFVLTEVINY